MLGAQLRATDRGAFPRQGLRREYAPGKARTGLWCVSREGEVFSRTPNPRRAVVKAAVARERLGVDEVDEDMRSRK